MGLEVSFRNIRVQIMYRNKPSDLGFVGFCLKVRNTVFKVDIDCLKAVIFEVGDFHRGHIRKLGLV